MELWPPAFQTDRLHQFFPRFIFCVSFAELFLRLVTGRPPTMIADILNENITSFIERELQVRVKNIPDRQILLLLWQ